MIACEFELLVTEFKLLTSPMAVQRHVLAVNGSRSVRLRLKKVRFEVKLAIAVGNQGK